VGFSSRGERLELTFVSPGRIMGARALGVTCGAGNIIIATAGGRVWECVETPSENVETPPEHPSVAHQLAGFANLSCLVPMCTLKWYSINDAA
jgi:hypothetical protein